MSNMLLNNTYQLERKLAAGGMGTVFISSHTRIKGRMYAIKQLHSELAATERFRERFLAEAEAMMELDHPNIVRIEDFLTENGEYYLVMEFVEGSSLEDILHKERCLPSEKAADYFRQLLVGLDFCHEKGIIHRDLKPSNLLITPCGTLKITDFGIARQENVERNLTQAGTILGTPDYMSPEQIVGQVPDIRSDIYSCGIILYEMLSGNIPYAGSQSAENNYAVLYAHLHEEIVPLTDPTISPILVKTIDKCLEKRPENRFQNVKEVLRFLKQGKEDTALSPNTQDWKDMGLEGRPSSSNIITSFPTSKASTQGFDDSVTSSASLPKGTQNFERGNQSAHDGGALQTLPSAVDLPVFRETPPTARNTTQYKNKKRSFPWVGIASLLVFVGLSAGGIFLYNSLQTPASQHFEPILSTQQDASISAIPEKIAIHVPEKKTEPDKKQIPDTQQEPDTYKRIVPDQNTQVPDENHPKEEQGTKELVLPQKEFTVPKKFSWPTSTSDDCKEFLHICSTQCMRNPSSKTLGYYKALKHCKRSCWNSRHVGIAKKFCLK